MSFPVTGSRPAASRSPSSYSDAPRSHKRPAGPIRWDSRDSEVYAHIREVLGKSEPMQTVTPFKRERVTHPHRERVSRLGLFKDWLYKLVGRHRRPSAKDINQASRG